MSIWQKGVIAGALVVLVGAGIYQSRQASLLRVQVRELQQQKALSPSQRDAQTAFQTKVEDLESQNGELARALAQAKAENARLETEREQARHSASLYKELAVQTNSKDSNPTNEYPSPRYVWTAFGKLGRLAALSKEDDSKLSPEEKAGLEAQKAKALEALPNLIKAAKYFDSANGLGADGQSSDKADLMACLLYGALNLDEQQFDQTYTLVQKYEQAANAQGLSQTNAPPDAGVKLNQMLEQFKGEMQGMLTPEQAKILAGVLAQCKLQAGEGNSSFSFGFSF